MNTNYLSDALKHVESKNIRLWATTPHNKAIMLNVAAGFLAAGEPVEKMTLYIVANAIGLW